jgi:hypothetical protein
MSQLVAHSTPTRRGSTAIEEVLDLTAGFGIILLPLFATSLAGVILFLVAPVVLVLVAAAIPVVLGALLLAPPFLIGRFVWRHARPRHISSPPSVKPVMAKNL